MTTDDVISAELTDEEHGQLLEVAIGSSGHDGAEELLRGGQTRFEGRNHVSTIRDFVAVVLESGTPHVNHSDMEQAYERFSRVLFPESFEDND